MRAGRFEGDEQFEEWLQRAQTGDSHGFDALVRSLQSPLLGFARARRADDPHGVVNEVFVRMFRSIGQFSGGSDEFRAWIFRIARNLIVDQARAKARRVVEYAMAPSDLPVVGITSDHEDHVDERPRIDAILAGLSAHQREVLILRVVADLSVEDTARIMGRSPGSVRILQHRALAKLREKTSVDL